MQGIPEMHDIPTMRDVSAFTMVRNLIIGSLPRATSRKRNPRKDKNKVTPLPRKTQCSERDIARVQKSIHEIFRQTARKNSKNEETEVNKSVKSNNTTRTEERNKISAVLSRKCQIERKISSNRYKYIG